MLHASDLGSSVSQGLGDEHVEGVIGGDVSTSRSETCEGSERDDLPGSPLSECIGTPTRQMGSPTRQTMVDRNSTMSESVGSATGWSEKDMRSDTPVNGQRRTLGTSSKKSSKSSSRFVMLDEDAESRETKNGHHTTTTAPLSASVSVASSGCNSSLHDDLPPILVSRAHTENLDHLQDCEPEKVVTHQKVGRFDVGIKKESKTLPKHPSLKDISDLGKAYVPPATALLPRMLEMMEHFKDQYSALQRMIEVITEADRGKAHALQRLLAQPLFSQKTSDGTVVEERVLELEKKVKVLDADNRALRERSEQLEQQLAKVAAVASVVAANGPADTRCKIAARK